MRPTTLLVRLRPLGPRALLAVLAPLALTPAGCASGTAGDRPVEIRIENASPVPFERVEVGFPGEDVDYGPVAPGARTPYHAVGRAYRYARIEVHVAGDTLRMQPIDFVGEELLVPGRYTYVIGLESGQSQLSLSLRPDG